MSVRVAFITFAETYVDFSRWGKNSKTGERNEKSEKAKQPLKKIEKKLSQINCGITKWGYRWNNSIV